MIRCCNRECGRNDKMLLHGCQHWNTMRHQPCGFIEEKLMKAKILITDPLYGPSSKRFQEGDVGPCFANGRKDDYEYTVTLGGDNYIFKPHEIKLL